MSLHPGGSTLHTHRSRRSCLRASERSASEMDHGSGGTHACTAGVKGLVMMSFSIRRTSCAWGTGHILIVREYIVV